MTDTKPICVGLIGLGRHMINSLLPNILATRDLSVVAAADLLVERRQILEQRLAGVTLFSSGRELIEKMPNIDAVIIATDPKTHTQCAQFALEMGRDVFVEKPPAMDAESLLLLASLAEKRELVTMVGTMWRYSQVFAVLEHWRMTRSYVPIRHLAMNATFPAEYEREGWSIPNDCLPYFGQFIHAIDCAEALMGYPEQLQVYPTRTWRDQQRNTVYNVTIVLSYALDQLAVLNLHSGASRYHTQIDLSFGDGSFATIKNLREIEITCLPSWCGTFGSFRDHPAFTWDHGRLYRNYGRVGYAEELSVFADSIRNRQPTPTSFREAACSLSVVEACIKSEKEGKPLGLPQRLRSE